MARDKILAGIDVGTSKITTLVAAINEEAALRIIGVASIPSKGIRKGQVVDIEEATQSVIASVEAAERMAGYSISSAYVSVGGSHIASQNSHGVVAVAEPEKEISVNDIDRVVDAAKAISLPSSREIIHVLPRGFIVDVQEGIKDPVGMTGVRLEVDTHLITVGASVRKNLEKCLSEVGIDVLGFVFGGLASAEAVLTDTEKELGIILIDIGAGTTDICIYIDGALSYSAVLPIGAKNITNDIAIGLRVSLESAEKIKLFLGKKIAKPKQLEDEQKDSAKKTSFDEIDLSSLNLTEGLKKTSKRLLIDGIIKPRLNEIFNMVMQEVRKSNFLGLTPSGIVITGGGAETISVIEAAKRNLAMPVRTGLPGEKVTGLIDEILSPAYSTPIGLLIYGSKFETNPSQSPFNIKGLSKIAQKIPIRGTTGKLIDLIKSFLP